MLPAGEAPAIPYELGPAEEGMRMSPCCAMPLLKPLVVVVPMRSARVSEPLLLLPGVVLSHPERRSFAVVPLCAFEGEEGAWAKMSRVF